MHYQRFLATGTTDKKSLPEVCSVDGCGGKVKAKGLCLIHYTRFLRHGTTETSIVVNDDKARFLKNSKISESGCWVWQKGTKNGYGHTMLKGKPQQAHRASWMIFVGDIPNGMQINHKCHNRACINPDHLYVGDQKQNMADMMVAGRANPLKGEQNGHSKLTAEKVLEIRASNDPSKLIAENMGVSVSLVRQIKRKLVWTHI